MATNRMDITSFVGKLLEENDVDLLREGVRVLAQAVMETEVSGQIGAAPYERSSERVAYRNGYRTRRWDTRTGTIELKIPKLTAGAYFPSLLEPRRRAEKALHAVVVEAYVKGRVHTQDRRPGPSPRDRGDLSLGGLPDLQVTRRGGRNVPHPPDRRRASLRLVGRDVSQGPSGLSRHLGRHGGRDRGQRPGTAHDLGCGHRSERRPPVLDVVPTFVDQARPQGRASGDLRCS